MKLLVHGPTLGSLSALLLVHLLVPAFSPAAADPASRTFSSFVDLPSQRAVHGNPDLFTLESTGIGIKLHGVTAAVPFRVDLPALFVIGYVFSWLLATTNALRPKVRYRRAWRVGALLLSTGLSMLLAASFIGGRLDERGVLHEPFFLIGIGSLLCLSGFGLALSLVVFDRVSKIVAHYTRR